MYDIDEALVHGVAVHADGVILKVTEETEHDEWVYVEEYQAEDKDPEQGETYKNNKGKHGIETTYSIWS